MPLYTAHVITASVSRNTLLDSLSDDLAEAVARVGIDPADVRTLIVSRVSAPARVIERFRRELPPGWLPLILSLDGALRRTNRDTCYAELGQRWGEMRLYLHHRASERARELASHTIRQSRTICEECGSAGVLRRSEQGWYRTLCTECAAADPHGYAPTMKRDS